MDTDQLRRETRQEYFDSPSSQPPTKESRDLAERDRDRILYTDAFRRLRGVTQVAHTGESTLYHDRMSHTLKVAQIGRRLAEYMEGETPSHSHIEVDPAVVEAAGLAHDLGHPPFSHPAETELNRAVKEATNGKTGFEGNAQAFRIVTKISTHGKFEKGLNLTAATLNAIVKYPWGFGEQQGQLSFSSKDAQVSLDTTDSKRLLKNVKEGKWGYYETEKSIFQKIRELEPRDRQRTLEGELMNWADDLVYAVHDVEDFYRAGVIPLDRLLAEDEAEITRLLDGYERHDGWDNNKQIRDFISEMSEWGIDSITTEYRNSRKQRRDLKHWSSELIDRYVSEDPVIINQSDSTDQYPDDELGICVESQEQSYLYKPVQLEREVHLLKSLLSQYVLNDPTLQAQREGERRLIRELFELLFSASGGEIESVHRELSEKIIYEPFISDLDVLKSEMNEDVARARVIGDMITMMTEQQATDLHSRLTGEEPGSLQDRVVQ